MASTSTGNVPGCFRNCALRHIDRHNIHYAQLQRPKTTALPAQKDQAAKLYTPVREWQTHLLTLRPGDLNQPLLAQLAVVDLVYMNGTVFHETKQRVQYKTLSYCWGAPVFDKPILIDEIMYSITGNLFDALQRIRQESNSIYLWVDALCINQHDVAERSMQVSNMLAIYTKASNVLVWLGELRGYAESCLAQMFVGRDYHLIGVKLASDEERAAASEWPETGSESGERCT